MGNREQENKIVKAIIPVAGFGTRFLPATKAQPKEMLPIVDKPVIHYLVEEAAASGIKEIIFVTGRGKRAIEDYFDNAVELETFLVSRGKKELAEKIHAISSLAKFVYVRQKEPKGPGDALLEAAHLIGREPFAVLYGDDVVISRVPCLEQMRGIFSRYGRPVIAIERVPKKAVSRYGIIGGEKVAQRTYRVDSLIEKPKTSEAPSNLAVIGKYIYTPELFDLLPRMKPGPGGELYPTDIFDLYIKEGGEIYGYEYEGTRYDCGEKLGFLKAIVQAGLNHPEVKKDFRAYLKGVIRP
jgi:UTP--glucose-1-phosphate uridylyltransferase